MKKLLYLFQPASIFLIAACTLKEDTNWQQQLMGTYTTTYKQAYSAGWDTLIIQPVLHGEQVQYRITKHTRYQRKLNGKEEAPHFKQSTWLAAPHDQEHTLSIIPTGRVYHFDEEKNTLLTGNTLYQKLK